MTRKEHLLTIAAEECNEVAQRISKALRFSLEEIQPGQELNNAHRILEEYNDLVAVMLMLHEEGHLPAVSHTKDPIVRMDWVMKKVKKVNEFLLHSKENGTLTDDHQEKANKWDALAKKMGELYSEDDEEADLVDIGEAAATAFGYL